MAPTLPCCLRQLGAAQRRLQRHTQPKAKRAVAWSLVQRRENALPLPQKDQTRTQKGQKFQF
jgi:hypothetical protein